MPQSNIFHPRLGIGADNAGQPADLLLKSQGSAYEASRKSPFAPR